MPLANFANDQRGIQNDFPSILEVSGRRIKVTATEISQEITTDENGLYVPKAFDVIGVLSDFGTLVPENRQTVILDKVSYQVGDIETDAHTDSIRLFLHKS